MDFEANDNFVRIWETFLKIQLVWVDTICGLQYKMGITLICF